MFFSASLYRWGGENSYQVICLSFLLSYPLAWLAQIFPSIEWYTLYIHFCHLICVVCFSFGLIQTRERPGICNYFGLIILVVYVLQYMFEIEFTVVSYFTMSGGLLLVLKSRISRYRVLLCSLGFIVFVMGCVIRSGSCIGILPFLGTLFFITCFCEKNRMPELCALGGCALFAVVCCFLQDPLSTVSLDEGSKFCISAANKVRADFSDYSDDSGLDKESMYLQIGCTRNDIKILENWLVPPSEFNSDEYWKRMSDIRNLGRKSFLLSRCWELFISQKPGDYCYRWSVLGCVLLLFVRRHKRLQPADLIVFTALFCLMILGMRGRFNDRAMMAVLLPCFSLWAMLSPWKVLPLSCKVSRIVHVLFILLPAFLCVRYGCLNANIKHYFSPWGQPRWKNEEVSSVVYEECKSHPNFLYFSECHFWRDSALPGSSLWSGDLRRNLNFFPFDGWMALFPSFMSALKEKGIENPSLILLNENNRFFLRAESEQDVLRMKGEKENLFKALECMFIYMQEKHGITLKLEVEKKLMDDLYVARVVRVED